MGIEEDYQGPGDVRLFINSTLVSKDVLRSVL